MADDYGKLKEEAQQPEDFLIQPNPDQTQSRSNPMRSWSSQIHLITRNTKKRNFSWLRQPHREWSLFEPYGRDPEPLEPPNPLGFNTRYYGISVKPVIRQQYKIVKSWVDVAESRNFCPNKKRTSCSCKLIKIYFRQSERLTMCSVFLGVQQSQRRSCQRPGNRFIRNLHQSIVTPNGERNVVSQRCLCSEIQTFIWAKEYFSRNLKMSLINLFQNISTLSEIFLLFPCHFAETKRTFSLQNWMEWQHSV